VVARPDPMWGETPCAFVTLKPEADASAEDVIAFCRAHLARFKAPRTVIFGLLPKTSTGKIQKFMLRERPSRVDEVRKKGWPKPPRNVDQTALSACLRASAVDHPRFRIRHRAFSLTAGNASSWPVATCCTAA